jgi:hypothetical protein
MPTLGNGGTGALQLHLQIKDDPPAPEAWLSGARKEGATKVNSGKYIEERMTKATKRAF